MKNRPPLGFSLLEVLAAIAILAVLVMVLVPVTARVIEQGRQARCAGNLRAIGSMISVWASENNGEITPCSNTSNSWPFLLAGHIMNRTLKPGGSRFDVFYCPTLSAIGHKGNSGPTTGYWTTYAVNGQVMGTGSATYPIRRFVEFSKPSRTGVMWDACPSLTGPPNRSVVPTAYYHIRAGDPGQSVGWVHGSTDPLLRRYGLANVLFLDGHVEAQRDPGDGHYLDIARRSTLLWE